MMKILHLADIHLNAKFHSKSLILKNHLKNARKEALVNAFRYAMTENVKALIIAGDFLDHSNLDYMDEKFVVNEFSKLLNAGIAILYTTGNHDTSYEQKWSNELKKFPDFYMFSNDYPEVCTLMDEELGRNIKFVGCGHLLKNENRNLVALYPVKNDEDVWIGIAHTSVVGHIESEAKAKYMPTTLETLKEKNYDYFALGHIHKRQFLADNIAYSGSLEPLDISEIGPHGGVVIEVLKTHVQCKNVNFNILTMTQEALSIEGISSLFELEKTILGLVANHTEKSDRLVLRLYLKGKTVLYSDLKNVELLSTFEEHIRETLNLLVLEIDVSGVHLAYDLDLLKKDDTLLSQVLTLLDEKELSEELLKEIPGISMSEKMTWWLKNKAELEDEIVSRLLRIDYEN